MVMLPLKVNLNLLMNAFDAVSLNPPREESDPANQAAESLVAGVHEGFRGRDSNGKNGTVVSVIPIDQELWNGYGACRQQRHFERAWWTHVG